MTTLSDGNLSIKDDSGDISITPTGHDRLSSASEDVVLVRHGVREAGKLASRAVRLHEAIYARHPGINCLPRTALNRLGRRRYTLLVTLKFANINTRYQPVPPRPTTLGSIARHNSFSVFQAGRAILKQIGL